MTRVVGIPSSRVANFLSFQRDPLQFLINALPLGEMVSLRTSSFRPTFIVNSPAFVQEILVHQEERFRKGRSSNVLRRTIGDGLLTAEHERHRQQKKYLTPVFYKERIQAYAEVVMEETERLADTLQEGVMVPMHDVMMQLTLGIISRSMFKTELHEAKTELAQAVDDTIRLSAKTIFSPIILPLAVPTPKNRKHLKAIRSLEDMIYDTIAEARRNPEQYADSLLGLLLDTRDDQGDPIPDVEIRDQMMTMLLAGHETTANAIVWALYALDRERSVDERLYEEIQDRPLTVRQMREGQSAFDLYRGLAYTRQVIQETLRLYPPAWAILREAEQPVEMLGDHFPANSSFLISPYAIHRNDRVFGDAAAFRPERFDAGISQWPRFAYFPFGGGARGCIGSQFALMEAGLILAVLARRFRFTS
ncbi:cytochrome P450, partial [Paenibacillus sepulcri]|nr:cytochrome P450 [Paenibacillus sepulcri]